MRLILSCAFNFLRVSVIFFIHRYSQFVSESLKARLEAGKFCSESESSEMISVYQESISGAAVWLANGRI